MISDETYEAIMENKDALDSAIIYDRDFQYNYVSAPEIRLFALADQSRCSVRFQDPRAILSLEDRRQDCRTSSAHDHACCGRYLGQEGRQGHRNLQLDE